MASLEDGAARLIRGVLVGGCVGAVVSWAACSAPGAASATNEGAAAGGASDTLALLRSYPSICGDSNLFVALQEPSLLFQQLDPQATRSLLQNLENLVDLFSKLRAGCRKPGEIAVALKERRGGSNRLRSLLRKARQKRLLARSKKTFRRSKRAWKVIFTTACSKAI